jgi:hypothetical protein
MDEFEKIVSQLATSVQPITRELIHAKKNMSQVAAYLRHIPPLSPLARPVYRGLFLESTHRLQEATTS